MEYESFTLNETTVINIKKSNNIKKLYIEASSECNLNCKMCFKQAFSEESGFLEIKTFKRAINETINNLQEVVFGGIGEPLTHRNLTEMLQLIREKNSKTLITINTNGTLITDKIIDDFIELKVNEIAISCETGDIGHSNIETVLRLTNKITQKRDKQQKGKPIITITTVLTKENYQDFPLFAAEVIKAGASKIMVSNLIPTHSRHQELMLLTETDDQEKQLISLILNKTIGRIYTIYPNFKIKTERYCPFIEKNAAVLRWDGKIAPCYRFLHNTTEYFLKRQKDVKPYIFGDLNNKDIYDIWNEREYLWFRFKVKHNMFPSCTDCKFREYCDFLVNTDKDCWGNSPSCADCLWYRSYAICP